MTSAPPEPHRPAFRIFSWIVVGFAVLLVWLGAATTTKQAGMVFADWPLSLGTYNPPGWLKNLPQFLEHSHRLLAQIVGILVLVQFSWVFVRTPKRGGELAGLVLVMAAALGFFIAAGSERVDAGNKRILFSVALMFSILPVAWLAWSWRSRNWDLVRRLSALALLMVTTQAILGGLRVTEISNAFAVAHGCFAQAFFCVLILIALAASPRWESIGFARNAPGAKVVRICGVVLVVIVAMQLGFGASMRHFHRHALPDTDLILTQGRWIPSFDDPMIVMLFLHKFTAFVLLLYVTGMCLAFESGPRRHALAVLGVILFQITLGLMVIGTGKSFWVTNVHVLNGLLILALSFIFAVRAVKADGLAKAGGVV